MPIFKDRVCETSTTTGTGAFTLAGALVGHQSFSGAGVNGTQMHHYLIETVDSNGVPTGDFEVGVGVMTTSTNMTRNTVLASSNSGALVNFGAGTKRVHLAVSALKVGFQGANVTRGTNLTAQNFTTSAAIAWSTAGTDTDADVGTGAGFYAVSPNPSRITIPANAYDSSIARLRAQISLANITVADWVELKIRRDGTTVVARRTFNVPTTTPCFFIETGIDAPAGGSYYELMIQVGADTSVDVVAADSFFELEILQ